MNWWPALLGWPAVVVALTLTGLGLLRKQSRYLHIAAILILPISLYLAATPRFAMVTALAPLSLLLAGLATQRKKLGVAAAMVMPVVVFFGWLAVIVLQQPGPRA